MDKKYCDLCKYEFTKIDRVYFISYGESGRFNRNKKSGEICQNCCKVLEKFIDEMKQ